MDKLIELQLKKSAEIKSKRDEIDKYKANIKQKEGKLSAASSSEDYDLAEKLQFEIDKLNTKIGKVQSQISQLTKEHSDLQTEMNQLHSKHLLQVKDYVYKLIELETKVTTEKNIYEKNTEEHLNDQKQVIKGKEIRISETHKELENRIIETKAKLSEIEQKWVDNAKEHIDEKTELESQIQTIDSQISDLEKQLNMLIDQKEQLEDQRTQKIKIIKKINAEFEPEIEDLKEVNGKYERKLLVNSEAREVLEWDKVSLQQQEEEFKIKLQDFQSKISEIIGQANEIKTKLRQDEREFEKFENLINDYQSKTGEYEAINAQLNQIISSRRTNEVAISEYETELTESYVKLDEHDKTLEDLEVEKKAWAISKKFKEAKRVKDLITLKTSKKEQLEKRIEEVKYLKEGLEQSQIKNEASYIKLNEDQANLEKEIKLLEYHILNKKKDQILEHAIDGQLSSEQEKLIEIIELDLSEIVSKYSLTKTQLELFSSLNEEVDECENEDQENHSEISIEENSEDEFEK